MATYNGQDDCIVQLDDTGGSLADISDYVDTIDTDFETDIGQFPVLGQRFKQSTEGTSGLKGTMNIKGSTDAAGGDYIIQHWLMNSLTAKAGLKSLRVQFPDASTGSFQLDFEIRPASYKVIQAKAGESTPPDKQLSFTVDGAPTWTVIS